MGGLGVAEIGLGFGHGMGLGVAWRGRYGVCCGAVEREESSAVERGQGRGFGVSCDKKSYRRSDRKSYI